MYWQKSNSVQGKPSTTGIRFKENLSLWLFLATAVGVIFSIYFYGFPVVVVGVCGCLAALLLKQRRLAIVLLFVALSVLRTGTYTPTKTHIADAENLGIQVQSDEYATYEFYFKDEVEMIRSIPERVLGEDGALVAGVLFGDKSGLDQSTKTTFRIAGISHILAVSGLHVGILVSAVYFALKKVNKKAKFVIITLFMLVLIILSGFSPSVLRGVLMMSFFLFAEITGRRYNLLTSLFTAGTLILFAVPYHIFNIGFILSFTSTLGIGLFYKPLYARLKVLGKGVGAAVAMYIACQLTSLPVVIFTFREISILGVLGNIFAVPIVTFALICGLVGVLVYPIGLAYYPISFSAAFMEIIEYISQAISSVPFAVVKTGLLGLGLIGIYYGILALPCICALDNRKAMYTTIATSFTVILMISIILV